jgi:hypothetical protein
MLQEMQSRFVFALDDCRYRDAGLLRPELLRELQA